MKKSHMSRGARLRLHTTTIRILTAEELEHAPAGIAIMPKTNIWTGKGELCTHMP